MGLNKPVDFTTAKLLKDKGFNNKVSHYWNYNGEVLFSYKPKTDPINYTMAPTIAEVVMWLYEKHGIWIWVEKYSSIFRPYAEENGDERFGKWEGYKYSTPTEAYEAAILFCLEKI